MGKRVKSSNKKMLGHLSYHTEPNVIDFFPKIAASKATVPVIETTNSDFFIRSIEFKL